ncbi:disulfide bond formation protein B [Bacillus lacus]|uniref:Probable disulfide formation protein n=1 Tax=Metabacillus lacus TaxID=1983721 RepID=A0A7X2IXC8_9BACI|nr:disulfide oxidoreductase [Metabacillus lacus]MRX71567.1 disulfide bond formation protein B [Metabacillus lacus]
MKASKQKKVENYMFIAWAASFISTIGSLYLSEVLGYIPCDLCWYQRIFMYPLVILLGIAIFKKDEKAAVYSLALSAVGGLISMYHYGIQKLPFLAERSVSCGIVPCTGDYLNWLGFITIPLLALAGFAIVFIMSVLIIRTTKKEGN